MSAKPTHEKKSKKKSKQNFDDAATKWVVEFNKSEETEQIGADHHCLAAYTDDAVFSVSLQAVGGQDFTARGKDAIVKQWHAIRSGHGTKLGNALGRKVVKLSDTCLIQSYENVDFFKGGKKTISIRILAEVWKLIDGEWKVAADYVMVTGGHTELSGHPESFDGAATKWVTEFNASADAEKLSADHHCLAAYTDDSVFSVTMAMVGGADFTANGKDAIVDQWASIRSGYGGALSNAQGREVVKLSDDCLIQSYENVDFNKDGKKTISIRILAEIWRLIDGEWKVAADYVMVTKA